MLWLMFIILVILISAYIYCSGDYRADNYQSNQQSNYQTDEKIKYRADNVQQY